MRIIGSGACEKIEWARTKSNSTSNTVRSNCALWFERRLLNRYQVLSDLVLDSLIQKPCLGLDSVVPTLKQIGNKQSPGSKGATPNVQKAVVLTQSESCKQVELDCAANVVPLRGSNVFSIVEGNPKACRSRSGQFPRSCPTDETESWNPIFMIGGGRCDSICPPITRC